MAVLQSSQITGKFAVTGSRDQTLVLKDYDTTQRNSLQAAAGAMIFNNTTSGVEFYTGNAWSSAIGRTGQTGLTGAKGGTGNQGAKGPAGADSNQAGAKGPTGDKGPQGAAGHQGFQGATGPTGNQGPQGPRDGNKGGQGPQGVQGATGPANNQGGAQGIQGAKGPQGAAGHQGFQGATGPAGHQGFQGAGGNQGPKGPQGVQGSQGGKGPQGVQGAGGPQGVQGAGGPQGVQGAGGPQGVQGAPGWPYQGCSTTDSPQFAYIAVGHAQTGGGAYRCWIDADYAVHHSQIYSPNNYGMNGRANSACMQLNNLSAQTKFALNNSGNVYAAGNRYSDERKKVQIEQYTGSLGADGNVSGSMMSRLSTLKPKKFRFVGQTDEKPRQVGLIAQDVRLSFPELVDASNDGTGSLGAEDYMAVNYVGVNAVLLEAVREIKDTISSISSRVATLEG
tara:strand:- start:230 stop:1576 length:1347 start_codon:yes stop_codon:yes gene_type:complete